MQQIKIKPKLGTEIVSLQDKYTKATIKHIFSCPQFTEILNHIVVERAKTYMSYHLSEFLLTKPVRLFILI